MTQRVIRSISALPLLMRLGLLILVAGATLDLVYHAAPMTWAMALDPYVGVHGSGAHGVTLVGMIVTLLGLPFRRLSEQDGAEAHRAVERSSVIEE